MKRWAVVPLLLVLGVVGCAGPDADDPADVGTPAREAVVRPPVDTGFDYQLGGAHEPPAGTGIVVRDSTAEPAAGLYSVCYVNGFQTQPGEADAWGDLVLTRDGAPVTDPEWPDEVILDTGSAQSRQRIADRLARVIEGCADAGFDAVEIDNLDAHTRSGGALTLEDGLALARLLSTQARGLGLAVAQKNTPDAAAAARGVFDFAIAEDCGAFDECSAYTDAYDVVLDVEYATGDDFADLCANGEVPSTAIRRDVGLVPAGAAGYAFARCG